MEKRRKAYTAGMGRRPVGSSAGQYSIRDDQRVERISGRQSQPASSSDAPKEPRESGRRPMASSDAIARVNLRGDADAPDNDASVEPASQVAPAPRPPSGRQMARTLEMGPNYAHVATSDLGRALRDSLPEMTLPPSAPAADPPTAKRNQIPSGTVPSGTLRSESGKEPKVEGSEQPGPKPEGRQQPTQPNARATVPAPPPSEDSAEAAEALNIRLSPPLVPPSNLAATLAVESDDDTPAATSDRIEVPFDDNGPPTLAFDFDEEATGRLAQLAPGDEEGDDESLPPAAARQPSQPSLNVPPAHRAPPPKVPEPSLAEPLPLSPSRQRRAGHVADADADASPPPLPPPGAPSKAPTSAAPTANAAAPTAKSAAPEPLSFAPSLPSAPAASVMARSSSRPSLRSASMPAALDSLPARPSNGRTWMSDRPLDQRELFLGLEEAVSRGDWAAIHAEIGSVAAEPDADAALVLVDALASRELNQGREMDAAHQQRAIRAVEQLLRVDAESPLALMVAKRMLRRSPASQVQPKAPLSVAVLFAGLALGGGAGWLVTQLLF